MRRPGLDSGRAPERFALLELLVVVAAGTGLAVLGTWPLVLHLGGRIAADPGDPLLQAWQVAWDGHALVHQPLHFFQANSFWPLRDSLAFSDALIGYTPAGLLGSGPTAAVARYDLLFIGAIALAFAATYLLARELGAGRVAAACGGLACAYAPWRLGQAGHLHVLSVGGIPLSLFLLLRGYRRGSRAQILAGWVVAAWQVTIGFTLGLQLLYLLLAIGAIVVVGWLRRGRPAPDRAALVTTAAGLAVLIVTSAILARPYLRVLHDHPESHRTIARVTKLSPAVKSLVAAAPDDLVWGGATQPVRHSLRAPHEQLLFPGVAIVLLALLGLRSPAYSGRARRALGISALVTLVLALGFSLWGEWSPYRLLWELAPGWQGVRTPGRVFVLTSVALALLAAAGVESLLARAGRGPRGWAVAAGLVAALAVEGLGPIPTAVVPDPPAALRVARAPLFELPSEARHDTIYEFWSTDGFPPLVNGFSGFPPRSLLALRQASAGFPDRRSVSLLRRMGVRTVVVHRRFAARSPWRAAATKPVRGLGVGRRQMGDAVLFSLSP